MDLRFIYYPISLLLIFLYVFSRKNERLQKYQNYICVLLPIIILFLDSYDLVGNIVVDHQSLYVSGTTDPFIGQERLYLAKYRLNGGINWYRTFKSTGGYNPVQGIGLDNQGNIYVSSSLLIKVNTNGQLQWVIQKINADKLALMNNRLFLFGLSKEATFLKEVSLETGEIKQKHQYPKINYEYDAKPINLGLHNLVTYNKENNDISLVCSDLKGKVLWSNRYDNDGTVVKTIISDAQNNLYIAGRSSSMFLLGWKIPKGTETAFVCKIDNKGVMQWVGQYDTTEDAEATDVVIDKSGNIILSGWKYTRTGKTTGVIRREDTFIVKFNPHGHRLWVKTLKMNKWDEAPGRIALDAQNNIYVIGDHAIAKLDPYGKQRWFRLPNNETAKIHLFLVWGVIIFIELLFSLMKWLKVQIKKRMQLEDET